MKYRLPSLLFLLLCAFLHPAQAEESMPPTNLHRLITAQKGWLNTSRPLTPEDLQGRIILLDFWTYCCVNCMHVVPDLKYLEEKFGPDLTVIGVHSAKFKNERDSENIRQAILRLGIHHPVVNDFDFSTWNAFGVRAWPSFILINPRGTIEATYSGEGHRAELERDIERLRQQYAGKIVTAKLPLAPEQNKQAASLLSFPTKLAYAEHLDGKPALFVSDTGHNRILVLSPGGAIIDSIGSGKAGSADGAFGEASFDGPQGLLYRDSVLYIADTNNHRLRTADLMARTVSTLAGTGQQGSERDVQNKPALQTPLASPWALALYPDDRHIAIAMAGLHQLWSYDIGEKTLSVIAGSGSESIDDGNYPANSLAQPSGLSALDEKLYFVDAETSSLRVLENGGIKTLIGSGLFDFGYKEGVKGKALMQHPLGVFADDSGIYIADSYNHSIRRFDTAAGRLINFAGHGTRGIKDGKAAKAEFNEPNDVLLAGHKLYVADTNNNAIRVIDLGSKTVSTLAVAEPHPDAGAQFSDKLPNLEKRPPAEVGAGKAASVRVKLKEGWKINAYAPSSLALFDRNKNPIVTFDREALAKNRVALPPLPPGEYRLQGTFYYCQEEAGEQCLIKSFDLTVKAKNGAGKDILLPLNE